METKNDVLYLLNQLDFIVDSENDEDEKVNWVRKVLRNELQDVSSEKLVNMYAVLDDIQIAYTSQNFQEVHILTNVLHEYIFILFKEKLKKE